MKIIQKYANGAETVTEMKTWTLGLVPYVFIQNCPEGIAFYFELVDELPSGALLYREISRDQVREILEG